jgi:hypothetical protein
MEKVAEKLPFPTSFSSLDHPLESSAAIARTNCSSTNSNIMQEDPRPATTETSITTKSLDPLIITPLAPVVDMETTKKEQEEVKQAQSTSSCPRAVAYPSTPVDRYGFLITDK